MSNELIINVTSDETRVAFLEKGVLSELFVERSREIGIMGNIYKGKVQRVLPGMNAAFVEIGEDKAAFLYATDFSEELKGFEEDPEDEEEKKESPEGEEGPKKGNGAPKSKRGYRWIGKESIHKSLKGGQEILVQVTRDQISTKGARITSHISLPGRFLVYMPTWGKIGVSKKIESYEERYRLRQTIRKLRGKNGGGFIVRTASEGATEEELAQDVEFLVRLWGEILEKKDSSKAPALIQPELNASLRILRDLYSADIHKIIVDDPEEYEKTHKFLQNLMPELTSNLELYSKPEPIFDHFGIESEINRALKKKVWLKSGGYLIFDETEALTTIDVNTGRFTGKKNLEETILRNNQEALEEIAYQIKIRNLGGIIILDFIDMEKRSNREKIFSALKEALKTDRAKTTLTKISDLGLIEMTRKRARESLAKTLCDGCPYCSGKGYVKSALTVVYEIFREMKRLAPEYSDKKISLHVHPSVFNLLNGVERRGIENLEKKLKKKIEAHSKESYHLEEFHIVEG